MNVKRSILAVAAAMLTCSMFLSPALASEEAKKVEEAVGVVKDIMAIPEKGIPPALLSESYAIAVIPGVIKLGFIIGGRHGSGVLLVRDKDGKWSNPLFVGLTGGSIGWQIGAQSTDVLLVFKSRKGVEGIKKGKFTLGADAAVAAGPVGRSIEAATDVRLKAEIYSYSRSRGLFAGISLEGAALQIDDDANASFYGKEAIRADDILAGKAGTASADVVKLQELLTEYATVK
jgi:lipid-binding SYLF domain-containing protein